MIRDKRNVVSVVITALAILIAAIVVAIAFQHSSRMTVLDALSGVAEQNRLLLQREIAHVEDTLSDLRTYMEQENDPVETRLQHLRAVDQANGFKRMGIITADGTAYTTDGQKFDARNREYYEKSMSGVFAVSQTLADTVDGNPINVCSVPMQMADGSDGVLFATYSTEKYAELLTVHSFGGEGYSSVVRQDGASVIAASHKNSLGEYENLFDRLRELSTQNEKAVQQMEQNMTNGSSAIVHVQLEQPMYISYQPLDINDWYLLMVVPESVAAQQSLKMLAFAYAFTIICAGAMLLFLFHIVRLRDGNRRALEKLAYEDPVTGGATKARFDLEVDRLLAKSADRRYAMVTLDLEKFQYINDLFGYEEGDSALRTFRRTLEAKLGPEECCARLQADQFAALCLYTDKEVLEKRLLTVQQAFNNQVVQERKRYKLSFKAGASPVDQEQDVNRLLDQANLALQQAKKDAVRQIIFFDDRMRMQKMLSKGIGDSFEQALARQEFVVWFQPKYYADRGGFYGAEALVRWQTEDGMISPGDFIPVLEQNGGIRALDRYVFESVCRMLAEWKAENLPIGPISVNISRLHLYNESFVQDYLGILAKYELSPTLVQLELTETVIFDNEALLQDVLGALREAGIRLEMDDFGAGYSSVKMMMNAPIDVVKLDKTMVDASSDLKGRHVLENIVRLAHTLGISVTAEGVETEEQFRYLIDTADCDVIQGYYCRRPMPAREYEKLLREPQ